MSADWKSGLFGCFDNIGICVITYLFPCVTIGRNAEALGTETCLCGALLSFIPIFNLYFIASQRTKIREKQGIDGTLVPGDCCVVFCCPELALIQMAKEIDSMTGTVRDFALHMDRQ